MRYLLLFFLISVLLTLSNCGFFEDAIGYPDPPSELPPITTSGENTFGCMINGTLYIPTIVLDMVGVDCCLSTVQSDGFLNIGTVMDEHDQVNEAGFFQTFGMTLVNDSSTIEIGIYDLTLPSHSFARITRSKGIAPNYEFRCRYEPEDIISGELNLIRVSGGIVSGTFEFAAVNDDCDTVRVTDGRFDLTY